MKCFGEKRKTHHCKIVLLDDTELIQEVQSTSTGQDLLDVVFRHLNLLETPYFGLRFIDTVGQTHWLDPHKKVVRQLKDTTVFSLYFGVKFYASDPCKLLEEITRYQFFLQVKQDILQGRLPVSFDLAAQLFAYAVQSELGDYDARRHQTEYISEFRFSPNQTSELEAKVVQLHKDIVGVVPSAAEMNFLERVKWLDMFGVDLHPVLGKDSIEYYLGLTPSGVLVLRNKTKVGNYFWPRITKVYFKGKYFMLRVRDKSNDEHTYGFELPTKLACKHLWKCCVEHHAFFRLTQVRETPGQSGKVFSLGSRFRGRTQKQVQSELFSSSRDQPTVVRVPSRRYQRRLGQPDGADASTTNKEESMKENGYVETKVNISVPQPVFLPSMQRASSMPSALPQSSSPRSTRSAPWEDHHNRGLYSNSTNPSPRSVRSSASQNPRFPLHKRTVSMDSDSSYDSRRRRHRSRRGSDNESEVSKSSKGSKMSKSSRRSRKKGGESGSETESQNKKKHSRHHRSGSHVELVDSEAQWREVQKLQQDKANLRPQSAVVRDLSHRRSGYQNSGMETESEMNYQRRKKHRRHRSRSKSPESRKTLPTELKQHIDYNLVDPSGLTEEEMKDIKYTKVETDIRLFKIRYSPTTGRPKGKVASNPSSSNKHNPLDDDPPPPYSLPTQNGPSSRPAVSQARSTSVINLSNTDPVMPPSMPRLYPVTNGGVPGSSRFTGNANGNQEFGYSSSRTNLTKSCLSQSKPDILSSNGDGYHDSNNHRLSNGNYYNGHHSYNGHQPLTPSNSTPRVTFQTPLTSTVNPKPTTQVYPWSPSSSGGHSQKPEGPGVGHYGPENGHSPHLTHEMSTEL